jgi:outer membrane protein TolC
MPLDSRIELKTPLKRDIPVLDAQKNIRQALENRNDYLSAQILLKSALVRRKLEENNTLPDLNLILKLTPKGQDESLATASQDMSQATFYQSYIGLEFSYPLGEDPAKIKYKNALLDHQIQENNVAKIREGIIAEVMNSSNEIKSAHDNYQIASGNQKIADQFYSTVLAEYRKGRYTVFKIKEALDSQTIANNLLIQTLVQFNIALVKRQVTINTLFSDYKIQAGQLLSESKGE